MKIGFRTPSPMKSIKARTTGKVKRKIKRAVNPLYGKKGMGLINDPQKAVYNAVYSRTSFGVSDVAGAVDKAMKPKKSSKEIKLPIYQRAWFIFLALFLLAPVGIFLLWRFTSLSKPVKTALSVFFVCFFLLAMFWPQ